ncbi:hypothetical protein AB0365_10720 [Brevibacterium casei]|uniref:hypothetical protein n=1 Tax=Brevibacterium casei TaxID=33889 RepID=UPI0034501DEA
MRAIAVVGALTVATWLGVMVAIVVSLESAPVAVRLFVVIVTLIALSVTVVLAALAGRHLRAQAWSTSTRVRHLENRKAQDSVIDDLVNRVEMLEASKDGQIRAQINLSARVKHLESY